MLISKIDQHYFPRHTSVFDARTLKHKDSTKGLFHANHSIKNISVRASKCLRSMPTEEVQKKQTELQKKQKALFLAQPPIDCHGQRQSPTLPSRTSRLCPCLPSRTTPTSRLLWLPLLWLLPMRSSAARWLWSWPWLWPDALKLRIFWW